MLPETGNLWEVCDIYKLILLFPSVILKYRDLAYPSPLIKLQKKLAFSLMRWNSMAKLKPRFNCQLWNGWRTSQMANTLLLLGRYFLSRRGITYVVSRWKEILLAWPVVVLSFGKLTVWSALGFSKSHCDNLVVWELELPLLANSGNVV